MLLPYGAPQGQILNTTSNWKLEIYPTKQRIIHTQKKSQNQQHTKQSPFHPTVYNLIYNLQLKKNYSIRAYNTIYILSKKTG